MVGDTATNTDDTTILLTRVQDGDKEAQALLLARTYAELRAISHALRARHGADATLSTTEIVHEAYIRLFPTTTPSWRVANRRHFMALAARAMRNIVVDAARRRMAAKRGAGVRVHDLDEEAVAVDIRPDVFVALDDALSALEAAQPRWSKTVECKFFLGLTNDETAEVMNVSPETVKRDWRKARLWLNRELL